MIPIIIPVDKETYDSMCINIEYLPGWKFWVSFILSTAVVTALILWLGVYFGKITWKPYNYGLNIAFGSVMGILVNAILWFTAEFIWDEIKYRR